MHAHCAWNYRGWKIISLFVLICRYWNGLVCDPAEAWRSFPGPNHRFLLSFSRGSLHDGEWLLNISEMLAWTYKMRFTSILLQGRIACANVLSDLYAMGITECDNMLMLLSVSQKMNEKVSWDLSALIFYHICFKFFYVSLICFLSIVFCKFRMLSVKWLIFFVLCCCSLRREIRWCL